MEFRLKLLCEIFSQSSTGTFLSSSLNTTSKFHYALNEIPSVEWKVSINLKYVLMTGATSITLSLYRVIAVEGSIRTKILLL